MKFKVNQFYDGGLIRLDNLSIPSKRVGYKQNEQGILVAKVPIGVPKFEEFIKKSFSRPVNGWPLTGRIMVSISIGLKEKEYKSKDIDNMTKTILDAFCGIAYEDDKQIDSLIVSKIIMQEPIVMIAFKNLGNNPQAWFIEPLLVGVD